MAGATAGGAAGGAKTRVVVDTDIGRDPDDAIALLFLCSREDVEIGAVTVWPGDADQVALARFLLAECGRPGVPIGVPPDRAARDKRSVTGCHVRLLERHGARGEEEPDGAASAVLAEAFAASPGATLLTLGPLGNVGEFLATTDLRLVRSVSMAGYYAAPGEPPVAPEFNMNGCPVASGMLIATDRIGRRLFVGKNVTHRALYDVRLHELVVEAGRRSRAMALVAELMDIRGRLGKKLHDPLAAAVLLREDIVEWLEVQPFARKRQWGCVARAGTGAFAATSVDVTRFRDAFLPA